MQKTTWLAGLCAVLVACGGGDDGAGGTKTITKTVTNNNTNTVTITTDAGAECADGVCVLSGTITEDLTLTSDVQWLLRGGVFIGDDLGQTTLTIEPGTTIYGENSTGGMLVVRRGSKLVAEGTADQPIVFTSSKAPGSRARGDWGGLILNGRAPINNCSAETTDVCQQFGEGGTGFFGGSDPNDNSGVLTYVRVEFAGTLISPDNELNGIAFQGVGSGTEIDHIQVHMNADDGVEFFGGTAQAKHVLVTGVGDDGIDWTDGWTGAVQFAVVQQYADSGDNGIEADNNGENNDALPRSQPILSHVTVIGSPDSTASDYGALLRDGTAGELHNVVLTGFNDACLALSNLATLDQADSGALVMAGGVVDCAKNFESNDGNGDITDTDVADFFASGPNNTEAEAMLSDPYNQEAPNFAPMSGSPLLTGGMSPSDAFFDAASYRGGVDPANDWTAGWTTSEPN